jgi:tetratricopeptide (TPR) repeat protein
VARGVERAAKRETGKLCEKQNARRGGRFGEGMYARVLLAATAADNVACEPRSGQGEHGVGRGFGTVIPPHGGLAGSAGCCPDLCVPEGRLGRGNAHFILFRKLETCASGAMLSDLVKSPWAWAIILLLVSHATASAGARPRPPLEKSPGIEDKPAGVGLGTDLGKVPTDLSRPDRLPEISAAEYTLSPDLLPVTLLNDPGVVTAIAGNDLGKMDSPAQFSEARRLLAEQRPGEAWPIFERLLKEDPGLADLRYHAAVAAHLSGKRDRASSLAAQALERGEDSTQLQMLIGIMATKEKDFAGAAKAYERALEIDPSNALALYNFSELLREQRRPGEAVEKLRKAIQLKPDQRILRWKIRLAQIETGDGFAEIESQVINRQGKKQQTEDWLITAAAVHLKNRDYRQAEEALRAAKSAIGLQALTTIFSEDLFFRAFSDDKGFKDLLRKLASQ